MSPKYSKSFTSCECESDESIRSQREKPPPCQKHKSRSPRFKRKLVSPPCSKPCSKHKLVSPTCSKPCSKHKPKKTSSPKTSQKSVLKKKRKRSRCRVTVSCETITNDDYEDKVNTTIKIKWGAPVVMLSWYTIWKIVLGAYAINAVCIFYGLMLFVFGIETLVRVGDFINMVSNGDGTAIPVILMFAGVLCMSTNIGLVIVTWFSCGKTRNRVMNTIHFFLIIVTICLVFLLISFATFCVVHTKQSPSNQLHFGILDAMMSYKNDSYMKMRLDILQITFKCCGSKSYSEWFDIPWFDTSLAIVESGQVTRDDAPFSCCSQYTPYPCIHHDLMSVGSSYLYAPETNLSVSEHGCHWVLMRYTRTVALNAFLGLLFLALLLGGLSIAHRLLQTAHIEFYRFERNSHWHTAWLIGCYRGKRCKLAPKPPPIPDELMR